MLGERYLGGRCATVDKSPSSVFDPQLPYPRPGFELSMLSCQMQNRLVAGNLGQEKSLGLQMLVEKLACRFFCKLG